MKIAATGILAALLAVPAFAGVFDGDECRYNEPRRAQTPAAGISKVVIHAVAGSLEVGGVAGADRVVVDGQVCTSESDLIDQMTLTLRKRGSVLHIDAEIPEKRVIFGFYSARLDFSVTLPAGIPVEIEDGSGWIRVSSTGPTSIHDGSGAIEVRGVEGSLEIRDGSGGIDVDGVGGPVSITDGSGEILIRNIRGDITLEDGSGAISVSHAEGSLHIRDDGSGSIGVRNVRGSVLIDDDGSGAVDVADIGGDFTLRHKGSGSISHERVAGKVSVPSRH